MDGQGEASSRFFFNFEKKAPKNLHFTFRQKGLCPNSCLIPRQFNSHDVTVIGNMTI